MLNFIVEHLSEISNFSMAIATVIMALYSKKSIDEMKISRKEANKANIVFYVELKERHLNFVIKNTGKTTAYDVKIRSNPKFRYDKSEEFNYDSIFKNTIPSMPPGFEIKVSFNDTIYILTEEENLRHDVNIAFNDIYGDKIHEKVIVDFSYLKGMFPKIPNDIDSSLHNININLEQINKDNNKNAKNLHKILKDKKKLI